MKFLKKEGFLKVKQNIMNKIEATDTSIKDLMKGQKFTIDYFQREYRWTDKHIKLMIEDLTSAFLKSHKIGHKRSDVINYQSYYLGPVVFSISETGRKSIVDGQQRITSITLLLIYLNHLQVNSDQQVSIRELIFSEKFGEKSFNMSDEMREPCLKSLFEIGEYKTSESDDETIHNMVDRYEDIVQSFPDELMNGSLPFFIDWLIENVVIVEIKAYSDENAYIIFETMNDRGLNLTSTEMLKGYVLSNIKDAKQRYEINDLWKNEIQKLHKYANDADIKFFQAWFRAKYAVKMRQGKAGAKDQDFELIGSRFHNWFKENHRSKLKLKSSNDFYNFFKNDFPFMVRVYIKILNAHITYNEKTPHTSYINNMGIAESLQYPLLLASINFDDDIKIMDKKIDYVSRYIETFTVRRAVNYRKFAQSSIKYTMFNLIKQIRDNDVKDLSINLKNEILEIQETWDGILEFGLHGQNRKYVKHILSRISSYLDKLVGKEYTYLSYYSPKGKPFEIEHLWANKFSEHLDEFSQENDFARWRNLLGALILLPKGTNQSFSSDKYEKKLEHYLKENTYAQTLHKEFYIKNPNFLNHEIIKDIEFKPHANFKKEDVEERQHLVKRICENIWSVDYFKEV